MKKAINNKTKNKLKFTKYYSYEFRVIMRLIFFIISLLIGLFLVIMSFRYDNSKSINYKEQSNVDYKVYLKDNDYYDVDYLGKDKLYIASIIDKINIDFDYNFFIDENVDLNFDYSIVGNLLIQNESGTETYFEKEYELEELTKSKINNSKNYELNKSVSVDYDYYNNLANNFKNDFKLNTSSKLVVYLKINKHGNNYVNLNNNSLMSVEIPLSQQAVNIKLDYKAINEDSKLIKSSHVSVGNMAFVFVGLIFIIISIINLLRLIKLLNKILPHKGKYQRYLNKLLTEYDRVIVNSSQMPDLSDESKIEKIQEFKELLDLRDMLKLPIKYYALSDEKSYFYLYNINEDKTYLHVVKKIDIEEDKK